MNDDAVQPGDDGFAAVLAEYLMRLDRGERVCRETFLQEHPQYAAALRDYFADVDVVERLYPSIPNGSQSLPHPPLGEFGDYELLNVIGRGGTGIVFRARKRTTGEIVALKMLLHSLMLSPTDVQRFRNEVATAAALNHPHIVPIHDVGEFEGHLYFTMPLFARGNLARRVIAGPMPSQAAAEMILAVAEAIDFAHQHDVIHRDLKPANVLLDDYGLPHISDFGLARQLSARTRDITRTGELLGTPNYMAPEQVMGDHSQVGRAVDIYALGAMLYALLVGRPPFHSKLIVETFQKISAAAPVPPRRHNQQVPPALETICLKCLEKSPADRYRSAAELIADLRHFLAGEPTVARRTSGLALTRRWFVRNPVTGMLVVGICLMLVAGTAFSLYYAQRARQREQVAQTNLYAADMNLAQQQLRSGAVASALELLERHRSPTDGKSQPPWEWSYLWNQCHGELRQFEGPKSAVYAAAFSPDGRTVAAAGGDQIVWLWETATGNVIHKLEGHTATIRDLAFSPDGTSLVSVADDGLTLLWDTRTGKRLASLVAASDSPADKAEKPPTAGPPDASAARSPLTDVDFSPDGRLIATASNANPKVQLWDAHKNNAVQSLDLGPTDCIGFAPDATSLAIAGRDGQVRVCQRNNENIWTVHKTLYAHEGVIHDVAWSPNGQQLATAGADQSVAICDIWTSRQLARIRDFKEEIYSIAYSPDGHRLAMVARHEPIKIWDFDKQTAAVELVGHTDLVTTACFCPEGWRILSASEDGTVRLWDALRPTDHDRLDGHLGHVRSVAFNPDGSILATGDNDNGMVILWNPSNCQPICVFQSAAINDIAFSPDGTRLAAGDFNQSLRIWEVATGHETLELVWNWGQVLSVAWRPDGNQLAAQPSNGYIRLVDPHHDSEQSYFFAGHDKNTMGGIAYSPDGRLLAVTGTGDVIKLWDTSTRSLIRELRGHTGSVANVAFDPRGTLLASSSKDRTIILWNPTTGERLRTLVGHAGTPVGLAFSPDGNRLASSSTDRTIKIWDVDSGVELQSLVGHTNWARDVAFSPNGQHLASAGYDGTVRVWHAPHPLSPDASELSTLREANALVTHLSLQHPNRESLSAAINNDMTINAEVRAAAVRQLQGYLYHWPFVLAGHRAAQRRNWPAAVEAFDRVTRIAPDDSLHWHWLAMASIAAGQHENYQRACNELIRRTRPDAPELDLWWASRTWCAQPHDAADVRAFTPLLEAYLRRFPLGAQPRLNHLRAGSPPQEIFAPDHPLGGCICYEPSSWYLFAITYLQAGDCTQANSYCENGNRLARGGRRQWPTEVYEDALRKEFEALLAAKPAPATDAMPSVSLIPASSSGKPAGSQPASTPAPAAAH